MRESVNYEIILISKNSCEVYERDSFEDAKKLLFKIQEDHANEDCDYLINKVVRKLVVECYYKRKDVD